MFKKGDLKRYVLLLFCLSITAKANVLATIPALQNLDKAPLKLVGKAQFSVLFWDIYQSRLYTLSGQYDGVKPALLFEITYLKKISKQELIERTIEQWQHLGLEKEVYQGFLVPLNALWTDITKGDRLALKVGVNESFFYLNGKYIGKIADQRFAQLFLDIWLSEQTSQPKLRLQLLGHKK